MKYLINSTKRIPNRGFTLIELLVVIAIIGILASVVLASLNTARTKARDAERISETRQVQNALELYFTSQGSYPPTPTLADAGGACGANGTCVAGLYANTTFQQYMSSPVNDPIYEGAANNYRYVRTADGYQILFWLEGERPGAPAGVGVCSIYEGTPTWPLTTYPVCR